MLVVYQAGKVLWQNTSAIHLTISLARRLIGLYNDNWIKAGFIKQDTIRECTWYHFK